MTCEVSKFLGGGGQGEVYAAVAGGKHVALKWYYTASATAEQRTALETLCAMGAPSSKFLWPVELASASGVADFGYIMPLREARYKSIVDVMKRRIEPSFRALATAGLELSHSFLQLHARGLCYRDISFGNAFFDPETGEVLICDNDNVTVDSRPICSRCPFFCSTCL
jgi:DNA-binding helix-hairpin-helix protein with protein kinase domain